MFKYYKGTMLDYLASLQRQAGIQHVIILQALEE